MQLYLIAVFYFLSQVPVGVQSISVKNISCFETKNCVITEGVNPLSEALAESGKKKDNNRVNGFKKNKHFSGFFSDRSSYPLIYFGQSFKYVLDKPHIVFHSIRI